MNVHPDQGVHVSLVLVESAETNESIGFQGTGFTTVWKTKETVDSEVHFRDFMDFPHDFYRLLLPVLSWHSR